MPKIPAIEHTYYYAVEPARVFAAISRPEQLETWFVDKARITPRKGSKFRFTWGTYTLRGVVEEAVAPSRLKLTWVDEFENGKVFETEVDFQLRKKGKGTVLKLNHRGFKSGKKWIVLYGAIESGWAYYLLNLRSVLEHGVDLRTDLDLLG